MNKVRFDGQMAAAAPLLPGGMKTYRLTDVDGDHESAVKGTWGGHRRGKIYGRLECRSALRAIANGGYLTHRVFFIDEATAIAAGYRPCGACCPDRYQQWKAQKADGRGE